MEKIIIFGAGKGGETAYYKFKDKYEIIYFTDYDDKKYGNYLSFDVRIEIKDMNEILKGGFDYIVIASLSLLQDTYELLTNKFNIPDNKIIKDYLEFPIKARISFLESFSAFAYEKNISGSICEVGVFRGEFAKEICRCFPDRKCYLFDTFEGFDKRDIEIEEENSFSNEKTGHFLITSEEVIREKIQNHNQIFIKKGYFPESFDLINESFCFVNLDTDLYAPTLAGLKLFYPLMEKNSVILIHDYFSLTYKGAKAAVDEFIIAKNITAIPIGDTLSVAIIKD